MIHAPEEWIAMVQKVLRLHLPDGYRVILFGSRATGVRLKRHSDFDLCIRGDKPLSLRDQMTLRDAFTDSDLSVRVDVADWHELPEFLKKIVEEQGVDFPF